MSAERSAFLQFGLFALVGVVGTAAHYAVLLTLVEWHGVGPVVASGWGALTGLIVNYTLNYFLTFRSDQSHWRTFPRFALIASIGLALNQTLMALLVGTGLQYLLAQLLVTGVVLIWNFFGNRTWTFQLDTDAKPLPPATSPRWLPRTSALLLRLGPQWLLLILAVRLATLGSYPLIDPTESRYAEMARKMVETGVWITPQIDYGVPFWGKPPLALWLNAINLELFGVSEFAARLSGFLLALGVLWLVYRLAAARAREQPSGGQSEDQTQVWTAPVILAGMLLFFVMAGSVATDQCLLLGLTLTMASFWSAMQTRAPIHGWLFFIGLAIGLMSKGPIALVLAGLPIGLWVLIRNEWSAIWGRLPWIKGTALMLALALPWYLLAELRTPGFLEYFLVGEHWKRFTDKGWVGDLYGSGRPHARGSIWLFWLLGALPWSLIFLAILVQAWRQSRFRALWASADGWRLYCLLWMIAPLLFFTLSANVILTYVLPGLPACALLLAQWRQDGRWGRWSRDAALPASIAALVPAGFLLLALALPLSPIPLVKTERDLVERYRQLRGSPAETLSYLGETPYSAQFYTRGQTATLPGETDLSGFAAAPGRRFLACSKRPLADFPEAFRDRAEVVGVFRRRMLLRIQGPGPTEQ